MTMLKKISCLMGLMIPLHCLAVGDLSPQMNEMARQSYAQASAQMPELLQSLGQRPMPTVVKKAKTPMVFISLGMPDETLKAILRQAHSLKMPVVIRGLFDNSLEKTLKKILALMPDEKSQKEQAGVLINPLWFREYGIDTVPAVVVPRGDNYDVLFGNIPLNEALEIIEKHHRSITS